MTPGRFGEAPAILDKLVVGAAFDIIHAVLKECPGLNDEAREAMIWMIVRELAIRAAIIEEEEAEATS